MTKDNSSPRSAQRLVKSLGCISGISLISSGLLSTGQLASVARAQESALVPLPTPSLTSEPAGEGFIMPPPPPVHQLAQLDAASPAPQAAAPEALAPEPSPVEAAPALPEPTIEPPAAYEPAPAPEPVYEPAPQSQSESSASGQMIDATGDYATGATSATEPAATAASPESSSTAAPTTAASPQVIINDRATGQKTVVTGAPSDRPSATAARDGAAPDAAGQPVVHITPPGTTASGETIDARGPIHLGGQAAASIVRLAPEMDPVAAPLTSNGGNASTMGGYSVTFPTAMGNPVNSALSYLGQQWNQAGAGYFGVSQRPLPVMGNGDRSFLFPLTLFAPISSTFGWRTHPIFGEARFHSGMDLAAEQGTPVVAPLSGRVNSADFMGGYGLAVVLDHGAMATTQTLFGHLSEIYVRPGQIVRQGEVIGRVGSTGNSTGPHLHFEVRQLTQQGWVAVDPSNQLEGAIAQLLNILRGNQPLSLPEIALSGQPVLVRGSFASMQAAKQAATQVAALQSQPNLPIAMQLQQLQQIPQPGVVAILPGAWGKSPIAPKPQAPLEQAVGQVLRALER
jgi:murein DD-endopeptidase MepM/ murein hydrolase activator NlpD